MATAKKSLLATGNYTQKTIGDKNYELKNHLGNVLAVVTNRKLVKPYVGGVFDGGESDLVSYSSYYPFSSEIKALSLQGDYRFGYQGSEKDDEVKGNGDQYTTHYRGLDPRLGRWLYIDPKASSMPWLSPYCSMDNNSIWFNEPMSDRIVKPQSKSVRREFRIARRIDPQFRVIYRAMRRSRTVNYSFRKASTYNANPVAATNPMEAVNVNSLRFSTFGVGTRNLPPGQLDNAQVVWSSGNINRNIAFDANDPTVNRGQTVSLTTNAAVQNQINNLAYYIAVNRNTNYSVRGYFGGAGGGGTATGRISGVNRTIPNLQLARANAVRTAIIRASPIRNRFSVRRRTAANIGA